MYRFCKLKKKRVKPCCWIKVKVTACLNHGHVSIPGVYIYPRQKPIYRYKIR